MKEHCSYEVDGITNKENLEKILNYTKPCPNCLNITLKKFKTLNQQLCIKKLDNDFARCKCGKRSLDIIMAHVLKIMNENGILKKPLLLKNGPKPLIRILESENKFISLGKNSLILLHPDFDKKIADILINEVYEVFGVLKGDSNALVGNLTINNSLNTYELLAGCDIRCDIIKSPAGEIIINKKQSLFHLEFSPSMENKILKLDNYFKSEFINTENIKNLSILDATCGTGSLSIYSLKYGFENVFFNDISKTSIDASIVNLKANGFDVKIPEKNSDDLIAYGTMFKIYNQSIEDFTKKILSRRIIINNDEKINNAIDENKDKFDYCILDIYPQEDPDYFIKIAKKIAKNIILI
jgi:hypothetical protein